MSTTKRHASYPSPSGTELKKIKVDNDLFAFATPALSEMSLHPDELEIMASYFSDSFEEQMGFYKVMAGEEQCKWTFKEIVNTVSFHNTKMTDRQWCTYKKKFGFTQTPRHLTVTNFTTTNDQLHALLTSTPYLSSLIFDDKKRTAEIPEFFYNLVLPPTLEKLEFDFYNPHVILRLEAIPLRLLVIGGTGGLVDGSVLPTTLESLIFGPHFNSAIPFSLASLTSLKHLKFGSFFNHDLSLLVIPPSLETLVFGYRFNHSLPVLAHTALTTLELGDSFNHMSFTSTVLPPTLKHLEFGENFDQPIGHTQLANTCLVSLTFGDTYHGTDFCEVVLPTTLEELRFGEWFASFLGLNQLANTQLKTLVLGENFYQANFELVVLPSTLISLDIKQIGFGVIKIGANQLAHTSLTHLRYGGDLTSVVMPRSLTLLQLYTYFEGILNPDQFTHTRLNYLVIPSGYDSPIPLVQLCTNRAVFTLSVPKKYTCNIIFPQRFTVNLYNYSNHQVFYSYST
jgi:hypothetical protein